MVCHTQEYYTWRYLDVIVAGVFHWENKPFITKWTVRQCPISTIFPTYFQHLQPFAKVIFLEILNHVSESPPTFFRYLTVTSPRFRPISLHHRQFGPASPLGWRLGDRNPAAGESSRRRDASRWPAPLCFSVANRCPEKTSSFGWENVGGWWRFFIGKNVMEWFQQGSHLSVDIITEDDPINQWTKGHLAGWRAKKKNDFFRLETTSKNQPSE